MRLPPWLDGYRVDRRLSTADTNLAAIRITPCSFHGFAWVYNDNAAKRYLKIYDKASAPVLATDTPVATIPIPGGAAGAPGEITKGIPLLNGLAIAITTGVADADVGAVAANEIVIALLSKP